MMIEDYLLNRMFHDPDSLDKEGYCCQKIASGPYKGCNYLVEKATDSVASGLYCCNSASADATLVRCK